MCVCVCACVCVCVCASMGAQVWVQKYGRTVRVGVSVSECEGVEVLTGRMSEAD